MTCGYAKGVDGINTPQPLCRHVDDRNQLGLAVCHQRPRRGTTTARWWVVGEGMAQPPPSDAAIALDGPAMTELSMPTDLLPHWRLLAQSPAIVPGARRRQCALRA